MKLLRAAAISLIGLVLIVPVSGADAPWRELPVVPSIEGKVRNSFLRDLDRSRESSKRPRVFAKVGDSNTEMVSALYGLGCSTPRLAGRSFLKPVINRYNAARLPNVDPMPDCAPSTSFSRHSAATRSGSLSNWALTNVEDLPTSGYAKAPIGCDPQETPLECEIRIVRPRYVLIMTGTNDVGFDYYLDTEPGRLTRLSTTSLVREVRRLGSVPVLSTLPPFIPVVPPGFEAPKIDPNNRSIAQVARRTRTPLINLHRALDRPSMHNSGMEPTGLHLGTDTEKDSSIMAPDPTSYLDSVDFRRPALRYGANLRNLVWLRSLARLDQVALSARLRSGS